MDGRVRWNRVAISGYHAVSHALTKQLIANTYTLDAY